MQLYFYADAESATILGGQHPKALLVGSDFGYGNFGDVLQHLGAAAAVRRGSSLHVTSVLALDAVSRHVDVASLRKRYGVDALMFVTAAPIEAEQAKLLGLQAFVALRNVSFVQLYGGGFLNESWGDFVLGVAEHFLQRLPKATYLISGQQVSPGYARRVAEHVERYKPCLVGVRDRDSLALMAAEGVHAEFSFDDAVEQLLAPDYPLKLHRGTGAFVHLNSSGYTGNDGALEEIAAHMRLVADHAGCHHGKLALLQAFQDAREEVVDSLETVKRLETGFPFFDVETILLVGAITAGDGNAPVRQVAGRFGYSCSYHVALWLQLSGIPCWLPGRNAYYDQKRRALGIDGDFQSFLDLLPKPDHEENLLSRSQWLGKLEGVLAGVRATASVIEWPSIDGAVSARTFYFKGEPRLESRLNESWAATCGYRDENERLKTQLDEAMGSSGRLQTLSRERDALADRLGNTEALYESAQSNLEQTRGELRVVSAQLEVRISEQASLLSQLLEATEQLAMSKGEVQRREEALAEMSIRFDAAVASSSSLNDRLRMVEQNEAKLVGRVNALSAQVTTLGSENRALSGKLREVEGNWWAACQGNEQLNASLVALAAEKERIERDLYATQSRLQACHEQIAVIGSEARSYREQAEWANASLLDVSSRERIAAQRLQVIELSRSWRWTRPVRVLNRYLRTGRFDSEGKVGLFGMLQIVGRKLPMPFAWRSRLGHRLERLRRH